MNEQPQNVVISWDSGTAYDFFFSLHVLHNPEEFGLRGSWAAGVRSRLPVADRKFLEESQEVLRFPLAWVYSLPQPKDGALVLQSLSALPPDQRLPLLTKHKDTPEQVHRLLNEVASRRSWDQKDRESLQKGLSEMKDHQRRSRDLECILNWWSRPEEFGERYLAGLKVYYDSFFAEEERRIQPVLAETLVRAQDQAGHTSWPTLLEELSQGVRLEILTELSELTLAPSYWSTPLILYEKLEAGHYLVLFGARPAEASLVPGDFIPDSLLRALKALADPTRLRILRYLSEQSLTLSQLSRLLRLRAPTVLHHLSALRLAGLLKLTLEEGGERYYAIRPETFGGTFATLRKFLDLPVDEEE